MAFYLMITNGNLNENFSKPRRRCSKCRKSGHNIATCPLIQKEKLNARAATADLNFSLSHNPENEYLSEIPDNISNKEDQKDGKKCVFCRKLVAVNDSGRPLLFFVVQILVVLIFINQATFVKLPLLEVERILFMNL
ncbi:hypothetical protein P9112_005730 [Eukaryota sp. TZLM1-RC]